MDGKGNILVEKTKQGDKNRGDKNEWVVKKDKELTYTTLYFLKYLAAKVTRIVPPKTILSSM
jgi:hypothetical protein